jgi:xanthine dehydrogenase accessory factor
MFDVVGLQRAIDAHGPVARLVIAAHDGSSPREVGAAMLVWAEGQSGTIGGGALEWEAMRRARGMLRALPPSPSSSLRGGGEALDLRVERLALGPSLGQCCGGAVTVFTEVYARAPDGPVVARSVDGRAMPLAVGRILARARGEGVLPEVLFVQGWMVEPALRPVREVWVWGAGHVGRAVVGVFAPLPGVRIVWCDVDRGRFPDVVPEVVQVIARGDLAAAVDASPIGAEHLVMTYSHALDLELCHRLLGHGFLRAGLIGSATKWARFRSRLEVLGHAPMSIARIECPIGDPALGKHPQAIAIGVAGEFLASGGVSVRKVGHG